MFRPHSNFSGRCCAPLLATLTLAACGGGSDGTSGDSSPPPPNQNPVADAGADQVVIEEAPVTLDGTGSTDSDGAVSHYQWEQTAGPLVTISNGTLAQAEFDAPTTSADTTLTFRLSVTDDDGATSSDSTAVTVEPATSTVSGRITAPEGTAIDGDVNDPNAEYRPNDDPSSAQVIPTPVTVGGYVNLSGAGEDGRSLDPGDTSDYYRVQLIAGQTIALFVADTTLGDPDLYLWDATGTNILDASINAGSVESLTVPSTGEFLVEAYAFDGASNYSLTIGQTQSATAFGGPGLSDDFVPGEAIMRFKARPSGASAAAKPSAPDFDVQMRRGGSGRESLVEIDVGSDTRPSSAIQRKGNAQALRSRLSSFADDDLRAKYETLMAVKALNSNESVEFAQPNYRWQPQAVPNDEYYPLQWHYPLINLPAAWDLTTGSSNVTVAVIDSGVLSAHPDMQGQLVAGYDFVSNPERSGDGDGIDSNADDPGDGIGEQPSIFHGTHVAGTVAAATHNGSGVAGVAWNAKVMPVRVLGIGGGTTYDIIQGVRYAAGLENDSGLIVGDPADILNLSLGWSGVCDPAAQDVISRVRAAGSIVVVAAGNDNADATTYTPASCDGVITVSSVGADKSKAPYSNFGAAIDIAAPGGDRNHDLQGDGYPDGVLSPRGSDASSSISYTFGFLQGTSMASPHVAGVVALMKSVNPALTPDQVDSLLASGELTNAIGSAEQFGNGLVDAQKAVAAALEAAGTPPSDDPQLGVTPGTLSFGTTSTLGVLTVRNTGAGSLTADPPTFSAPWLDIVPADVAQDNLGTYTISVDRTGLEAGIYADVITIQSNVNTIEVPVIMQAIASPVEPDAGLLYTLLIDTATGEAVQQSRSAQTDGEYSFEFTAVPDGQYEIVSGTDSDNDGFICDPGEACGGYPTLFDPQMVEVEGDRSSLDFSAGHVVAIPAALSAAGAGPEFYPRALREMSKVRAE